MSTSIELKWTHKKKHFEISTNPLTKRNKVQSTQIIHSRFTRDCRTLSIDRCCSSPDGIEWTWTVAILVRTASSTYKQFFFSDTRSLRRSTVCIECLCAGAACRKNKKNGHSHPFDSTLLRTTSIYWYIIYWWRAVSENSSSTILPCHVTTIGYCMNTNESLSFKIQYILHTHYTNAVTNMLLGTIYQ